MVVEPTKTFTSMTIPVIMQVEFRCLKCGPVLKFQQGLISFRSAKCIMSGRHQTVTLSLKMTVECCGIWEMI